MTLAVNALATLQEIKDYMEIKDKEDDSLLGKFIDRASQWIESYCNRVFRSVDYDELYDGNANGSITVAHFPIITFTTLEIDGTAVIAADFYWYDYGEVILKGGDFGTKRQSVHCVYTAGYAATPVDLTDACIKMASMGYYNKGKDRLGVTSKTLGREGSVTFNKSEIPIEIMNVLDIYRQISVGSNRAK
jgi:hypothetical protein